MSATQSSCDTVVAAEILLDVISGAVIDDVRLAQVAHYFSAADGQVDEQSFFGLVGLVQRSLPHNLTLQALAMQYREGVTDYHCAAAFIQDYVKAVASGLLPSQPLSIGYHQRQPGQPFDQDTVHQVGLASWGILYTTEGEGVLDTRMRRLSMRPGDAVLLEPGSVFSFKRSEESENWAHYWIAFQAASNWRGWLEWPAVGPSIGRIRIAGDVRKNIELAMRMLLASYSEPAQLKPELDHNLLEQIILRCRNTLTDAPAPVIDLRIKNAQRYIGQHFHRKFTIADVAEAANISPSTLAHLFKKQTGLSVMAWRDEKRMMRAALLLRTTTKSIAAIAAETGYDDTPYFNRTFKRLIGKTPGDYRTR